MSLTFMHLELRSMIILKEHKADVDFSFGATHPLRRIFEEKAYDIHSHIQTYIAISVRPSIYTDMF